MKILQISLLMVFLIFMSSGIGASGHEKWSPDENAFKSAGGTIDELYKAVTFKAGAMPDWQLVIKTFFIEKAVLVLRTGRDKMSVITRDGFAKLFIEDIEKYKLDKSGFQEKLISTKLTEFGSIADCRAVYEVSIPGSPRKQRGVDFFQLMKKNGRWWIVSIINEVPSPDNPIPEEFLN